MTKIHSNIPYLICENWTRDYRYIARKNGNECWASNDYATATKHGPGSCGNDGGLNCLFIYERIDSVYDPDLIMTVITQSPLDFQTYLGVLSIDNTLPFEQRTITAIPSLIQSNVTWDIFVEAKTGGVSANKKIKVQIEKIPNNCLGATMTSTIGSTNQSISLH